MSFDKRILNAELKRHGFNSYESEIVPAAAREARGAGRTVTCALGREDRRIYVVSAGRTNTLGRCVMIGSPELCNPPECRILFSSLVILGTLALLTACGGDSGKPADPTEPEPPRAVSILVSPTSATFASIGETTTFSATLTDQYGAAFAGTVTWSSDATEVFTVTSGGLVTAAGNGTGSLRASFQQLNATAQITVRQQVVGLEVSPALDTLFAIGDTVTFSAAATDANGHSVADAAVTWTSSAPRVATVDVNGLVTAVGEGRAGITATSGPLSARALVVASTVTRLHLTTLDTTVVVPIEGPGGSWSYEVTESRWLSEIAVGTVTRRAGAPGVAVAVSGPGWLRIDPVVSGKRLRSVRIDVVPPAPFVVSLRQADWPASDAVAARGYAVKPHTAALLPDRRRARAGGVRRQRRDAIHAATVERGRVRRESGRQGGGVDRPTWM